MTKSSMILDAARRLAADRVHGLVGQLEILLGTLPRFPEAFSPDELPISFVLRRDSPRYKGRRGRRRNNTPISRKPDSHSRRRARLVFTGQTSQRHHA